MVVLYVCSYCVLFFFFKHKTAYEMRISDWSSDVCSSDLLSLNMQFHELHDPRGLAKDVTNLGRWGNGDVEVGLSSAEDIPYVLGLVRQAFEKQMGHSEATE